MSGDCLFESLSKFSDRDHIELRRIICDFLEQSPLLGEYEVGDEFLMFEMGNDIDSYISRMRQPHVWGGAIEIQAFCELTGVKVNVQALKSRTNRKESSYEHIPREHTKGTLYILYTGNHFEALRYEP